MAPSDIRPGVPFFVSGGPLSILGEHHINEAIADEMPAVVALAKALSRRFERVTAMRCADIFEFHSPEAAVKIRAEFGVDQGAARDPFFDHLVEEILARFDARLSERR